MRVSQGGARKVRDVRLDQGWASQGRSGRARAGQVGPGLEQGPRVHTPHLLHGVGVSRRMQQLLRSWGVHLLVLACMSAWGDSGAFVSVEVSHGSSGAGLNLDLNFESVMVCVGGGHWRVHAPQYAALNGLPIGCPTCPAACTLLLPVPCRLHLTPCHTACILPCEPAACTLLLHAPRCCLNPTLLPAPCCLYPAAACTPLLPKPYPAACTLLSVPCHAAETLLPVPCHAAETLLPVLCCCLHPAAA